MITVSDLKEKISGAARFGISSQSALRWNLKVSFICYYIILFLLGKILVINRIGKSNFPHCLVDVNAKFIPIFGRDGFVFTALKSKMLLTGLRNMTVESYDFLNFESQKVVCVIFHHRIVFMFMVLTGGLIQFKLTLSS